MDADAYLRKLGWKGTGHALDSHGRGIKKPLLIAHKQDQLGLGKKKAAHSVDDQWWMRAFDESLKNIGTGQESTLSQVRTKGINRGGLYGFFVRGEGLIGTISSLEESSTVESSTMPSSASTPPTSVSDNDTTMESAPEVTEAALKSSKKDKKRKRDDEADGKKPEKKARKEAQNAENTKKPSTVSSKLAKLSSNKRAEYEERAALKSQTLEQYITRRMEKKEAKRTDKRPEVTEAMFFTDLEGDVNLANTITAKGTTTISDLGYTPLPDGTCPIDPTLWEGRVVKDLPKPIREARRKWLEQRRNAKKLRAGKKIEEAKPILTRKQAKAKDIRRLTREMLEKDGIQRGASSEQLSAARSQAKKMMKAEKKEKKASKKLEPKKKGKHRTSEKAKARNKARGKQGAAKS